MGNRTLEYDNHKGFKCQRCEEWTLGGHLYSSANNERICFLCHIEDVSDEMLKKHSIREQTLAEIDTVNEFTPSVIEKETPVPVAPGRSDQIRRDPVAIDKIEWITDLL